VQTRDQFEITEIGDKFVVVDASTTPRFTYGVHETRAAAERERERLSVVPEEWMRNDLFTTIAASLAQEEKLPYATVVEALEKLGPDEMWRLVDEGLDLIEQATGLAEE
jgi:hypothetical protein